SLPANVKGPLDSCDRALEISLRHAIGIVDAHAKLAFLFVGILNGSGKASCEISQGATHHVAALVSQDVVLNLGHDIIGTRECDDKEIARIRATRGAFGRELAIESLLCSTFCFRCCVALSCCVGRTLL